MTPVTPVQIDAVTGARQHRWLSLCFLVTLVGSAIWDTSLKPFCAITSPSINGETNSTQLPWMP